MPAFEARYDTETEAIDRTARAFQNIMNNEYGFLVYNGTEDTFKHARLYYRDKVIADTQEFIPCKAK